MSRSDTQPRAVGKRGRRGGLEDAALFVEAALLIENKAGGGTQIGAEAVAKSPADGHTLFATGMETFAITPFMVAKLSFDPDKDFKAIYAGSHTAAFEAFYNKKVDAGELNSAQLESARQRGHYHDGDLVFLWKSDPIPTDPIALRGDLPEGFKKRAAEVLQNLDLADLPAADRKIMGLTGTRFVPQTDSAYDGIRDLVKTLKIDLEKLG